MPQPGNAAFDAAWALADRVPGWFTRAQGQALWDAARDVPAGGLILEIGCHQGRSTLVLASAAAAGGSRVIAIDPFVAGPMFGGAGARERFEQHLAAAGLREVVRLLTARSGALRPSWREPLALLHIDGKHDYWTVSDDLRWAQHLPPAAPVFVHDAFSSLGVTLALLVHAVPGRALRYAGRTGSLARFEVGTPSGRDRLHLLVQLPWFSRNVLIKIALRVARVVGYHGTPDPY